MDPNISPVPKDQNERHDDMAAFDHALERDVEALDALARDVLALEEDDGARDDEW